MNIHYQSGRYALQVHQKKLKLGLYIDIGTTTCGGFPGSQGHFAIDALMLAKWNVDLVKVGACGSQDPNYINAGKTILGSVHLNSYNYS